MNIVRSMGFPNVFIVLVLNILVNIQSYSRMKIDESSLHSVGTRYYSEVSSYSLFSLLEKNEHLYYLSSVFYHI